MRLVVVVSMIACFVFARDFGLGWIYDYMRSGSAIFYGRIVYDDGTPAANATVRVVTIGTRVAVIRSKTDDNGSFEMKVPTRVPFRFGVWCDRCDPKRFVWYIRDNPGIPAGTKRYGKEW